MIESDTLAKFIEPVFDALPFIRKIIKTDLFMYILMMVLILVIYSTVMSKLGGDEN